MHPKYLTIILGVMLILVGSVSAINTTPTQTQSRGDTFYVGGSGPGNYTKIQNAIDNSSDGDTVYVYNDSAPYNEKLLVNVSISLIGEDKYSTIITKEVLIAADNVTMSGFTVANSSSNGIATGINLDSIIIRGNRICNNRKSGILVGGKQTLIENNYFSGNNWSGANGEASVTICSFSSYNKIIHNIFEDHICNGIFITGISNNISFNVIRNVSGGEFTVGTGIFDMGGFGEPYDGCNEIYKNSINYCDYGIYLRGEDKGVICQNTIMNCNIVGLLVYQSRGNSICHYTFLNNVIHSSFRDLSVLNTWDSNYWGRPKLLPHSIWGTIWWFTPWINFDWHPAQESYDIWNS